VACHKRKRTHWFNYGIKKSSDWVAGKPECPSENEFTDSLDSQDSETDKDQEDAMVLADENQCLCVLCGELFEDVYCHENS
jgi:pre-mRNA cleavage complex 2 protein Pcf11